MSNDKYVGLDVHQSSTVSAVHDCQGKCVMESILETRAYTLRDFLRGLKGNLHVTFEEGTHAAWLYDVVKPLVAEVIVCDPRQNKLLAVEERFKKPKVRRGGGDRKDRKRRGSPKPRAPGGEEAEYQEKNPGSRPG